MGRPPARPPARLPACPPWNPDIAHHDAAAKEYSTAADERRSVPVIGRVRPAAVGREPTDSSMSETVAGVVPDVGKSTGTPTGQEVSAALLKETIPSLEKSCLAEAERGYAPVGEAPQESEDDVETALDSLPPLQNKLPTPRMSLDRPRTKVMELDVDDAPIVLGSLSPLPGGSLSDSDLDAAASTTEAQLTRRVAIGRLSSSGQGTTEPTTPGRVDWEVASRVSSLVDTGVSIAAGPVSTLRDITRAGPAESAQARVGAGRTEGASSSGSGEVPRRLESSGSLAGGDLNATVSEDNAADTARPGKKNCNIS